MLHELLVAMAGVPGDIFVPFPRAPATPTTFAVRQDFPFLHRAERATLDKLAQLGFWCREISAFVDREARLGLLLAAPTTATNSSRVPLTARRAEPGEFGSGAYSAGLAAGLRTVLDQYLALVDETETELLNLHDLAAETRTPVTALLVTFGESRVILECMYSLVDEYMANRERYYGCRVLDLVLPRTLDGRPYVAAAMRRVAHQCLTVFFNHLSSYLLCARAHDPRREFFVVHDQADKATTTGDAPDHDEPRDYLRFRIEPTLLPHLIPVHLADSILFTVTSSYIVQQSPRASQLIPPQMKQNQLYLLARLLDTSTDLRTLDVELAIEFIRKDYTAALWKIFVLDEKLVDYLTIIHSIYLCGKGDFLTHLMQNYARLESKVHANLTLLNDRELNFLLQSSYLQLYDTPGAIEAQLIKQFRFSRWQTPMAQSTTSTTADRDDPTFPFRPFRGLSTTGLTDPGDATNPGNTSSSPAGAGAGARVHLSLSIPWPLSLVITRDHIAQYSQIFMTLAHVRRVLARVDSLHVLVRARAVQGKIPPREDSTVCRTRMAMRAVLAAVTEATAAEVDAQFRRLVGDVGNAAAAAAAAAAAGGGAETEDADDETNGDRTTSTAPVVLDLHDLTARHAEFVDAVSRTLFLVPPARTLRDALARILDVVDRFCAAVEAGVGAQARTRAWDAAALGEVPDRVRPPAAAAGRDTAKEIERLADEFTKETRFFFDLMDHMRKHGRSEWQNLLIRMDFNRYWASRGLGILRDETDDDDWDRQQGRAAARAPGWDGELLRSERSALY
ncbi:Gamma-tubulin complex component 4 [Allomyces arbusculus]|nr:Gamma-tubulin complex component 4 [Allomyces arbusculus]